MTQLHHHQNKMKELVFRTQASRVVIFAGHNSGGLPRPSARYYTTAVHWEIQDGSEGELHMSDYRNIPVDPIYIDMLLKSYDKDFYRYRVEKEPDSQLKRIYQSESITDSMIFFLDIHESNFIYLSTSTKEEGGFKDDEVTKIEVLAYNLKDLVRSANKDNKTN